MSQKKFKGNKKLSQNVCLKQNIPKLTVRRKNVLDAFYKGANIY